MSGPRIHLPFRGQTGETMPTPPPLRGCLLSGLSAKSALTPFHDGAVTEP